ncbi:MAG: hypothetical protein PHY64_04105 [Eubacteriales bacterium]|nr:hypothetical protein [Eubacteriales bacterium]
MNDLYFSAPWLQTTARLFAGAGAPLYAVGGCVRNALMELPASDIDVCGPLRPEEVIDLCEGTQVQAILRAAHFGTVELHITDGQGRHMAEYTTFREDSYRTGHQPVAVRFADSLEVDALRRDFSVNALYCPLLPGKPGAIVDPTGGLNHLHLGILHTVTENPDQVLKDDGLRILRAARFQAELGLQPTGALLASALKYAALLKDIACERLRDELARLLLADTKYPSLQRSEPPVAAGLSTVRATGAWPALFGGLEPDGRAIEAITFYQPPKDLSPVSGKMALLFYQQEPATLLALMRRLRFSAGDAAAAAAALTATRKLDALSLMDAVRLGLPPMEHASAALTALLKTGAPCEASLERANALLYAVRNPRVPKSLRELAVNGNDLLPICSELGVPNAAIGQTLDGLWRAVVESRMPNERDALLPLARQALQVSDVPETSTIKREKLSGVE